MKDMEFVKHAACLGMPVELFFGRPGAPVAEAARMACESCPVLVECRAHAIERENAGFWGGMTAHERKRARAALGIVLRTPEAEWIGHATEVA